PDLVLNVPTGSLLEQTDRLVVARQIAYGLERKAPWGVSESAFYARDLDLTYQYSNFGVGGLGLKRGLSEDYVVAPYATALAALVDPGAAARGGGRESPPRPRLRSARPAPLQLAARPDSSDAPPFERTVFRDAHRGGLGLQPLAGPRRDSLARRLDEGSLGDVRLSARRP